MLRNRHLTTKDFYNSSKAILEKINREVVGYKINLFEDDAEIIFKFLSLIIFVLWKRITILILYRILFIER